MKSPKESEEVQGVQGVQDDSIISSIFQSNKTIVLYSLNDVGVLLLVLLILPKSIRNKNIIIKTKSL